MASFWLICALLLLAALALLLPPLLRPAVPGPAARRSALALSLLLPLLSIGLYLKTGQPDLLERQLDAAMQAMQQARQQGASPMEQAIAGLELRLANDPEQLEGWLLLARAQRSLERFEAARQALAKAHALAPDDVDIQIEYAEAQVLASDSRRFQGPPLQLLQTALQRQPLHPRGLWLLGISQYQRGEQDAANATWDRLLASLPPDDPSHASLRRNIALMRTAPGAAAPPSAQPENGAPDDSTAATGGPRLKLHIQLAPELADRVQPQDVLFVHARAAQGPRMPLAIQRLRAADLPLTVVLDDSHAMVPQMNLSSQSQIIVAARISRSGNAQPQSGDLEAQSGPIELPHAETIALRIERIVP